MLYKANVPLIIKGDYTKKGQEVELSDEEVKQFDPADLSPVDTTPEPPEEPEPEVPIEEMSIEQLKAKAKELGLSANGSKAAVLERIQLHNEDITNETE